VLRSIDDGVVDDSPLGGQYLTAGPVGSPLRREAHGGFGERPEETDREQSRHRAPGLLSDESGFSLLPVVRGTWAPRSYQLCFNFLDHTGLRL
jgi:hypothetical protein